MDLTKAYEDEDRWEGVGISQGKTMVGNRQNSRQCSSPNIPRLYQVALSYLNIYTRRAWMNILCPTLSMNLCIIFMDMQV